MQQEPFFDSNVEAVFAGYSDAVRLHLMELRQLIFDAAAATEGVGALSETLKWGQPSYLTNETGSGTTLRIGALKQNNTGYALYYHCQTNLGSTFRDLFPETFTFDGNRGILLDTGEIAPKQSLKQCIMLALTYHLKD